MDDRQTNPKTLGRDLRETLPGDHVLSHGLRMVGSHEHEMLIAQGHYRCPHCRRADVMEMGGAGISRR